MSEDCRYRVRTVHGRIFLQGVRVGALVDHEAREIRLSDLVPPRRRRALLALARLAARTDAGRAGPFARLYTMERPGDGDSAVTAPARGRW